MPLLAGSAAAWLLLILQPQDAAVLHDAVDAMDAGAAARASALMFAAMMLPLIGRPLSGAPLLMLAAWIVAAESGVVLALAVAAAALSQCSPARQRCLNRCHAHTALSAFGAKADLDVLRFGFAHGWWCIGACSALMLLPMLFPNGHLVLMAAVTLWLAGERLERPMRPQWRWRGPSKVVCIVRGQVRCYARG